MKYYIPLLFIIFVGCSKPKKDIEQTTSVKKDTLTYQTPQTLSINGDFDGDGIQDTLTPFLADSTGNTVKNMLDQETWEETVAYFGKQGYYTTIALNHGKNGMLKFGNAQGLYCLINIGDLNKDNRDEIALVPDLMDFSRANSCRIYSLCSSEWKELFTFNVHEDAFDYTGDTPPLFTNIPGALEYRNNKWYYLDYLEMDYETAEKVGKMKALKVPKCK